ncbi:MAG TPA: DivIVA domain-containing protein [Balneolales bacterium]|nr:DivIVA domain-containing protein [Balneolales bacterium]
MKLTALEIKQQKFERAIRGYDTAEVNAFLGVIASEWEHMVRINKEQEAEINRLQDKLKHYERVESALHETLQTAKEAADNRIGEARKEAMNTIEKAEMEANGIVREAHQQRQQIRQSILQLLDRREEIIKSLRAFLDRTHESLDSYSEEEKSLFHLPKTKNEEKLTNINPQQSDHQVESKDLREPRDSYSESQKDLRSSNNKTNIPNLDDIDDILNQID